MKHQQDVILRGFAQQRFIEVHDFLGFVIEEVDLRAGHTKIAKLLEETVLRLRGSQIAAMLPEPYAHSLLPRVIHYILAFRIRPTTPRSFHDLMFEAER